MEPVRAGQPFQVIVDYAHTAPALRGVLAAARASTAGRVLALFGSAGERDVEKRGEMGAVAALGADYFVVTSEDPRFEDPDAIIDQITAGAVGAGARQGVDFDRLEDRRRALEHLLDRAEEGDMVILAGKGHERSMIYGSEARPWDEVRIAREILESMGYTADL
jgi:UDP-N-acetylmuramoyl-L-alanyl-D-glutamate--2,6-diaminopimelate ligase